MVSPVSVQITTRPSVQRDASPLTIVLVVPKIWIDAGGNITIDAPDNSLTEITASNATAQLGSSGFVRAAYNYIESRSVSRLFVLPFAVDPTDNGTAARLNRVVTALTTVSGSASELEKLPNREADLVVLPRETGLGTAAANTAFTGLAAFCRALYAIGFADAGSYSTDPTASQPATTDVTAWRANNSDANIMTVTNRADVAGYDGMFGSVVAASQWAYYTGIYNLAHPAANLRDQVVGASNFAPERPFDPFGTSEATTLKDSPNFLTSLITWDGSGYLWGGQSGQASENSPLVDIANHIVANRIVKQTRRDLAPYVGRRATERLLSSIQTRIQNDLDATYVAHGLVRSIDTRDVVLSGGNARVIVDVQFADILDTVSLTVEVYT